MKNKLEKKQKQIVAMLLVTILLAGFLIPKIASAFNLANEWGHPNVYPTWGEEPLQAIENSDRFDKYEKTGLAFNQNFYPSHNTNGWPLGAQMYLEERPGVDNSEYHEFNLKHTYCSGRHTEVSPIQPGARAFVSGAYRYTPDEGQIFQEAQRGSNHKFNFLMLAIACYYPGDYKVNKDAMSTAEDPAITEGLVMQAITWMATDGDLNGGFSGNWEEDYNHFKTWGGYRDMLLNGFTQAEEPVIYHTLRAPINPECNALKPEYHVENMMIDGWFWDVWQAALLTSQLDQDWDKEISTFNVAIKEDDGEYHADLDLFVSDSARMYLTDIDFKPYGDWERTETTEDGIMHFKSSSGELDENGSIGYLFWSKEHVGYFMPIDPTKAKLFTFDTWNVIAGGVFGHTQTQFSSSIEKGLNIYLTTRDSDEGDKEVKVVRHKHKENWETNYTVNLYKFDSETGKPIEGSYWDVLEKFDDSQLDNTNLDWTPDNPGSYESGLGNLVSTEWGDDEIASNYDGNFGVTESDTNRYNWGNDSESQFIRWDDPYKDPCTRDKNITGADGHLYEIDSAGKITGDVAHSDKYHYVYYKGYCDGHPAPIIEYVECDHDEEEEECDCEEINQGLHDDAWKEWYKEVETCEKLVEQGGFFHCIEPGEAAKKAMEEDRDEFYKDYISLTYEYSAVEIEAAKGYILHGLHTDDIPIEWRVVTSSEYKDTAEAANIDHNGAGSSGGGADGDEENIDTEKQKEKRTNSSSILENASDLEGQQETLITASKSDNPMTILKAAAETVGVKNTDETKKSDATKAGGSEEGREESKKENQKESKAEEKKEHHDMADEEEESDFADIDIYEDGETIFDATGSEATPSEARPETVKEQTGFSDNFLGSSLLTNEEEGGSKGYLRNSEKLYESQANTIAPPVSDIIDWTFIAYDHRTEGEIHFNKTDFNLSGKEGDGFNAYGQENADGSLEGAVYGLFAAEDITHPDTTGNGAGEYDTGIVFKEGDLVAVATTDRNGDGSFMAITEAPGSYYNYETGKIEHSDWYALAPKNLHIAEAASAGKEQDIERLIGHNPDNSEIMAGNGEDLADTANGDGSHTEEFFYKFSSNQLYDSGMLAGNDVTNSGEDTYREDTTTGWYPISNNEANNGNCWIGRPLLVNPKGTSYYIKELSRSEGYELSVYGKDETLVTNRKAFEDGEVTSSSGTVAAGTIKEDRLNGGITYEVSSAGTDNGYLVYLTGIPEGASINISTSQYVWDDNVSHFETEIKNVPIIADEGSLVMLGGHTWEAALGERLTYNGKNYTVNQIKTVTHDKQTVKPNNEEVILNPYLDAAAIAQSGNVTKDINSLFTKNGFRRPFEGSPWTMIEADAFTVEAIAKAVNEQIFTNGWFNAFNAMSMSGSTYQNGHLYIAISYSYRYANTNSAIYNSENDSIYVKTKAEYPSMPAGADGFIYRVYKMGDCEDVERNSKGFVTSAVVPNQTASGTAQYQKQDPYDTIRFVTRPNDTYWAYAAGEQRLNIDGSYAFSEEKNVVEKRPTLVEKVTNVEVEPVEYTENGTDANGIKHGTYAYKMTQEQLDSLADGKVKFRIVFQGDSYEKGMKEVQTIKNGHVSVILPLILTGSYMEEVILTYPGQREISQDGGAIYELQERPIRQKIKVNKDIRTIKEAKQVWYCLNCGYDNGTGLAACEFCGTARTTEETKTVQYAHDTYSAVHAENISAGRNAGAYDTVKDWLSKLLGGEADGEEAKTVPNFRFKTYLKSNLERLYRDQDGNIVWLDRNGNTMIPQYQDTNGDGNYDTFTWKYDAAFEGKEADFPEKDKITDDGVLESTNVQKIYTKVEHNRDSMTTSDQANNVWDDYDTPQGGLTDNVGEKEGFSTSQREKADGTAGDLSGKAVDGNAALYSYRGKNTNTEQTDRINEGQNTGYSRLLETRQSPVEDGAGAARQAELYNYEKFFDAIAAANTDIWDNDMHTSYTGTSMGNYPGQHWFEEFYEKYQKDDADPDHTLENTDGADQDNTAGGDRDTSFKPFRWIREHMFGNRADYEDYPAGHEGTNTEVTTSTSDFARANAEASDAVRQFAVKWYLEDEAAKLMTNDGVDEDIAKDSGGVLPYDEAAYDEALFHAIAKTYNYLKPFYENDLDTIYSVEWDSAENGGADQDYTTLSIDIKDGEEHYNVSSYLPYGVYVVVEQQPERRDGAINDWENRSYTIETPKEVIVPSVYDAAEANDTTDNYDGHYSYKYDMTAQDQAKKENYLIRFAEEWAHDYSADEREYVIRAHGYQGDYEIYKYGLDIDRLTGTIDYGENYDYAGWKLTQDVFDPLKDYYDTKHKGMAGVEAVGTEYGGNDASDYMAIHKTDGLDTANGSIYDAKPLQDRFFYGSISEDAGIADQVMFKDGAADGNDAPGIRLEDGVRSITGELTAYEGKYAPMLVPWTVTAPADLKQYSSADFTGYADVNERDGFYTTKLRINKVDSETGEYILHDNAIFALYAGSRYNTFGEIEEDAKLIGDAAERATFLAQFKPGDAKFYLKDTVIQGTREFLMAMGATEITPAAKGKSVVETAAGPGETCSGLVKKGTPICVESERIMLTDETGARTGQMTVYTTLNDVLVAGEKEAVDKAYANQNTGYFVTPQPIGAGVYVLAEIKAPDGYARSKPVTFEVYSDKTQYYVDGDMYNKVSTVRYDGDLLDDIE